MAGKLVIRFALVGLVSGLVVERRQAGACSAVKTEKFDKKFSFFGRFLTDLGAQVGSGDNGDLQFSGASKINFNDVLLPGTIPHSTPNTAAIGIVGTQLNALLNALFGSGQTDQRTTSLNPATTITPVTGRATSFDLKGLWVACGATSVAANIATLSSSCSIQIQGTDINGNDVSSEDIEFGPGEVYNSKMAYKALEGFEKLANATVRVVSGDPVTASTVLFLDDLSYCLRG